MSLLHAPVPGLALIAIAATASTAFAQSSVAASPPDSVGTDLPHVFLDCQAAGCDTDFLRTELTWLNFVRDRTLARVHLLATSRSTGSGGTELTVAFLGQSPAAARADTIVEFLPQGATFDEQRRLLSRVIGQGMMRFVAGSPLASRLSISYRAPAGPPATATRGARDPWGLWVFRLNASGYVDGDENARSSSVSGSFRAARTTAAWKTVFAVNLNYRENHYTLSEGEEFATYRNSYSAELLQVRSLDEHWSFGVQGNASSSVVSNLDLGTRVGPAIEYDLFPYSESTRRQIVLRYSVGVKSLRYDSLTVFGKLNETLVDHRFVVAADMTQPWGGMGGNITFNQYLGDLSKRSFNVGGGVSWRIVRGLNLNADFGYSRIQDQINIKRGELTDEEILLQLRQQQTGYSYYGSVGLSYTFGSIFQNVVNPRFTRNMGGWFF